MKVWAEEPLVFARIHTTCGYEPKRVVLLPTPSNVLLTSLKLHKSTIESVGKPGLLYQPPNPLCMVSNFPRALVAISGICMCYDYPFMDEI